MRYLLLVLVLLFAFQVTAQQEFKFKEYSFSEFFQMVEDEESDAFALKNAFIVLDTLKDHDFLMTTGGASLGSSPLRQDTLHIRKSLRLENVFFAPFHIQTGIKRGILHNIVFHESVRFENVFGDFQGLHFKSSVTIWFHDSMIDLLKKISEKTTFERFRVSNSIFDIDPRIVCLGGVSKDANPIFLMTGCQFKSNSVSNNAFILLREFGRVSYSKNSFEGHDPVLLKFMGNSEVDISGNNFGNRWVNLGFPENNRVVNYTNNNHDVLMGLNLTESTSNITIDWSQFENGIIEGVRFNDYIRNNYPDLTAPEQDQSFDRNTNFRAAYKDSIRIANSTIYKTEIRLLGTLTSIYRRQHDTESGNASYVTLKDLETERLEYLHSQNPSFDTFFEWKVNQFLKTFSDYGTKPAKAITFSVYVIFVFALIYLFFPNHWDSHGKNRIQHRFRFFYKYLSREPGIEHVYLEENKDEIENNEAFKAMLLSHKAKAPKLFFNLAMPLYRWSMAGTMTYAWLIKRFDFLKGTWEGTDSNSRGIKGFLVGLVFVLALLYDLFIKMLNALMLSINTFTTLGFGEIPIKGLPRYLAIIQGFIGWFMLTIFSVSLISQLLN